MALAALLRARIPVGELSEADLERLLAAFVVETCEPGKVLAAQGETGTTLYVVLEGEIVVTHARPGEEAVEINRLGAGELVGVVALFDEQRRSATCHAAGPVKVAGLSSEAMVELSATSHTIGLALQQLASLQLTRDFLKLDRRLREASAARDWFASTEWPES